jgi:cell division septum initiation protein DivIVA
MAEEEPQADGAAASRRRGARTVSTRRRLAGADLVNTLDEMVTQLINENRSLKRQLAKLEAGGPSVGASAERTLRSLQRKVQQAIAPPPTARRRRPQSSSTTSRTRRQP